MAKTTKNMTKATLNKKISEAKNKRKAELQARKDKRTLTYFESDKYTADLEKEDALSTVADALSAVEAIYSDLDRKVPMKFGYTVILDKLITLAQAVKYLPSEDKSAVLRATGMTELSVENLLDFIGNTAYYSRDTHEVVDSVHMDRTRLEESLATLEIELNISLVGELKSLSSSKISSMYDRAEKKAEELYLNTEAMLVEESIEYKE